MTLHDSKDPCARWHGNISKARREEILRAVSHEFWARMAARSTVRAAHLCARGKVSPYAWSYSWNAVQGTPVQKGLRL